MTTHNIAATLLILLTSSVCLPAQSCGNGTGGTLTVSGPVTSRQVNDDLQALSRDSSRRAA